MIIPAMSHRSSSRLKASSINVDYLPSYPSNLENVIRSGSSKVSEAETSQNLANNSCSLLKLVTDKRKIIKQ